MSSCKTFEKEMLLTRQGSYLAILTHGSGNPANAHPLGCNVKAKWPPSEYGQPLYFLGARSEEVKEEKQTYNASTST